MRGFIGNLKTYNDNFGSRGRKTITQVVSFNIAEFHFYPLTSPGYIAGITDFILLINPGIYVYSTNVALPAITMFGINAGDTARIINNGYIMGRGGSGVGQSTGGAGGPAISLGSNCTIDNTNAAAYIGGGGGAGGNGNGNGYFVGGGGGGGAGGGNGGWYNAGGTGGGGGAPGSVGSNGIATAYGSIQAGGGGGRIFPGTGGAARTGGGAGGGGAPGESAGAGGAGGAANANGLNGSGGGQNMQSAGGGGGGGWGATGGSGGNSTGGYPTTGSGPGVGGKAIALNAFTVTWVSGNTTRVYGAIS